MANKENRLEVLLYNMLSLLIDETFEQYEDSVEWFDMIQNEIGCTADELEEKYGIRITMDGGLYKIKEQLRADLVQEILDDLDYPYDDYCVNYIVENWKDDHEEQIAEDDKFEIDEEDVKIYWFDYVKEYLFS